MISTFNRAIDSELGAIRADGGRQISLRHRKSLGPDGFGNYYYSFRSDLEIGLPDDSPVEVKSAGQNISGALVRVNGFRILLALESRLPDSEQDILVMDPTFLLEGLKSSLTDVAANPHHYNVQLAGRLLQETDDWVTITPYNGVLPDDLNTEQKQAVRAALTQPVTYIWGPPGTGKTHTLASLVSLYLARGLTVLLLAHSNVAVDTVVHRISQIEGLLPLVTGHRIVRSGYPRIEQMKNHEDILASRIAEGRVPGVKGLLSSIEGELTVIEERVRTGPSSTHDRTRLSELRQHRRKLLELIRQEEQQVILEAQLVATTLARSAVLDVLSRRRFDAVVIDEASMAYVPHVYWAACLAREHLVIAGDFRQLGPVVRSESGLAQRWLKKDVFEVAGLVRKVDQRLDDRRLVGLRTQHRMHPAISRLVDRIYGGRLRDAHDAGEETEHIANRSPYPGNRVTLVDTGGLPSGCKTASTGFSRYNISSAQLAVSFALRALESGEDSIGVIAPYVAQAQRIQENLERSSDTDVVASTVHRFQGSERSLIIIDLVDGFPQKRPGSLIYGGPGSDAMRLINVAITRAQNKLIILADLRFLYDRLGRDSTVLQILKLIEEQYGVYNPDGHLTRPPTRPYQPLTMLSGAGVPKTTPQPAKKNRTRKKLHMARCEKCGQVMGLSLRYGAPYLRCSCGSTRKAEFAELVAFVLHHSIECRVCNVALVPESDKRRHYLQCPQCGRQQGWLASMTGRF